MLCQNVGLVNFGQEMELSCNIGDVLAGKWPTLLLAFSKDVI